MRTEAHMVLMEPHLGQVLELCSWPVKSISKGSLAGSVLRPALVAPCLPPCALAPLLHHLAFWLCLLALLCILSSSRWSACRQAQRARTDPCIFLFWSSCSLSFVQYIRAALGHKVISASSDATHALFRTMQTSVSLLRRQRRH